MKTKRFVKILLCALLCVSLIVPELTLFSASAKPLAENNAVALEIAEEGAVLLKNDDNCLPFDSSMAIGIYGNAADKGYIAGGKGSGEVQANKIITPKAGLEQAAKDGLIKSVSTMKTATDEGYDRVVYFISRSTTEGDDRPEKDDNGGDSYNITKKEQKDIQNLVATYPGKVTVVLNIGGLVDTTWLNKSGVSSILLPYYGGQVGGTAIANLLTGKTTPSGKTTDTWASSYDDYYSSKTFGQYVDTIYYEDIYVGYRQFETFDPEYKKVNYEFGFGLSYTTFDISVDKVSFDDGNVTVTTTVKNTGDKYSGKEVVQVYYSAPDNILGNPAKELGGFAKTKLLAPGESQTLTVSFTIDSMADYDDTGKITKSAYVLEKGDYKIYVGNSIKNAGQGGVRATYTQSEHKVVEQLSAIKTNIPERLLSNGTYETINADYISSKTTTIKAYGKSTVRAIDVASHSDWVHQENADYYNLIMFYGLSYLNSNTELVYNLKVEKAGTYMMAMTNTNGNSYTLNNMCRIYVNGVKQDVNFSCPATGGWYSYKLGADRCTVELPEGDVEFRIKIPSVMANLSHFDLWNTELPENGSLTIGAEYAEEKPETSVYPYNNFVNVTKNTTTLTYTVNAAAEGDYDLVVSYSDWTKAVEGAFDVKVNGKKVDGGLSLVRTGIHSGTNNTYQKYRFTDSDPIKIHLNKGENTVVLEGAKLSGVEAFLDALTFTPHTEDKASTWTDNTDDYTLEDLSGVTLETKIMYEDLMKKYYDGSDDFEETLEKFLSQLSITELANLAGIFGIDNTTNGGPGTGTGAVGTLNGSSSKNDYGVPLAFTADGTVGIRFTNGQKATYFPCSAALAATWNLELAYKFGDAYGKECYENGVDIILGPGMNIHRNPLCGRNFEYYSEDPLITGLFAAEMVKGCQLHGVSVSAKHFALNNQEINRSDHNVVASERAIREIYLKGFEIMVKEAKPMTIMSSYNLVSGTEIASNSDFMTKVLREEWGFEGIVVSDWSNNNIETAAILAGNNVQSGEPHTSDVVSAYRSGVITREQLQNNAKYIIKFLLWSTAANQKNSPIYASGSKIDVDDFNISENVDGVTKKNGALCGLTAGSTYYYHTVTDSGKYSFAAKVRAVGTNAKFTVYVDGNAVLSKEVEAGDEYNYYCGGLPIDLELEVGEHIVKFAVDEGTLDLAELYVGDPKDVSATDYIAPPEPDDPSENDPSKGDEPADNNKEPSDGDKKSGSAIVIVIVVAAVVVVGGVVAAVIISKKRKK